jgi:hypothetical protein
VQFYAITQLLIQHSLLDYGGGGMRASVPRRGRPFASSLVTSVGTQLTFSTVINVTIVPLANCFMLTANSLVYDSSMSVSDDNCIPCAKNVFLVQV